MKNTITWPKTPLGWLAHIALIVAISIGITLLRDPGAPHSVIGWAIQLAFLVPFCLFVEWLVSISYKFDAWHPLARILLAVAAGGVIVVGLGYGMSQIALLATRP